MLQEIFLLLQLNVTAIQPDIDAGLTLSSALKASVSSGRLGIAISSAVGYDVTVSSDDNNRMYILAQTALTQAQASAGITSKPQHLRLACTCTLLLCPSVPLHLYCTCCLSCFFAVLPVHLFCACSSLEETLVSLV